MAAPSVAAATVVAEWVTVCDECREPVSMFTLNDHGLASCHPCGHPARVSLVPIPPLLIEGPS